MKKFILTIIVLFNIILPAFCKSYMPKYNNNIQNYGIGLYFGTGKATVYAEPNTNSKVIAKLSWDRDKVYINGTTTAEPKNIFVVFSPENAISAFIALDEQGTEYTKIIYDNSQGLEGWIKNDPDAKVYYWRQLFYKYGRTKGLYIFANIAKEDRILRLAPEDTSETSYDFVYPKYIRLQLIKGNWALLKIVDYENTQKVGWFKWRNSDGSLNLFPKFIDN